MCIRDRPSPTILTKNVKIYAGQEGKFDISFDGTEKLNAYVQKNGLNDNITTTLSEDQKTVTVSAVSYTHLCAVLNLDIIVFRAVRHNHSGCKIPLVFGRYAYVRRHGFARNFVYRYLRGRRI